MEQQLQTVKEMSIDKGKRGVKKVVFGRVFVLAACFLIQFILLFVGMNYLKQYIYFFFGGYLLFGLLILFVIVNRTVNPGFQLSWAVIVLLFPVFGGLLYLYVEIQPGTHMLKNALRDVENRTAGILLQDQEVMEALSAKSESTAQLVSYIYREEAFPAYRDTGVRYFPNGEAKFEELLRQLKMARRFIFMEYFIVHPGYMWDSVYEILKTKVQEGVEVRFLFDGMNELYNVPPHFQNSLRGDGIQCKVFSPVYPVISTHYNNRDHRKIVVIDGHTAFTGGVNLADEYINRKRRFGHWKDAAVMVQGDAVRSFTLMFLRMWNITGKMENMAVYLQPAVPEYEGDAAAPQPGAGHEENARPVAGSAKAPRPGAGHEENAQPVAGSAKAPQPGAGHEEGAQPETGRGEDSRGTALAQNRGFVLPYAENPFHKERTAERVYLDILNHAKRYVYIMTPYLVPDYEMMQALTYAARRGVDVILLMPHIPDKKYAFALAHSYYGHLLQSGVRIYEYSPGFVHSKVFVSDDVCAVVGAINLDYRSLYLNFESAVFLYDVPAIMDIKMDFLQTLSRCQLMTEYDVRHDKLGRKLAGGLLKLLAPLM